MSAVAALVEQAIKSEAVLVFSKTYCPHCTKAKQTLTQLKLNPTVHELDTRGDGADIQDYLAGKTGQRTVPSIFVKGQFLGGNSDLQEAVKSGRLDKMLGL
jgi:glutaredoxin 3